MTTNQHTRNYMHFTVHGRNSGCPIDRSFIARDGM